MFKNNFHSAQTGITRKVSRISLDTVRKHTVDPVKPFRLNHSSCKPKQNLRNFTSDTEINKGFGPKKTSRTDEPSTVKPLSARVNRTKVLPETRPSTSSSIFGKSSVAQRKDNFGIKSNFSRKSSGAEKNVAPASVHLERLSKENRFPKAYKETLGTARTKSISTQTEKRDDYKLVISIKNGKAQLIVDESNDLKEFEDSDKIASVKNTILNQIESPSGRIESLLESLSFQELERCLEHKTPFKLEEESMIDSTEFRISGGGDFGSSEMRLIRQVEALQYENARLTDEKSALEKEKIHLLSAFETSSVELQLKIDEASDHLKTFELTNEMLKTRLNETEEATRKKNESLTKALEKVENKLKKTKADLQQREQEVLLHQKNLKEKCELYENLQVRNKSNEHKIAKLMNDIEKNNGLIKQIKMDVKDKSEEIDSLMFSLREKQVDQENQECILKELKKKDAQNREIQSSQARRIKELELQITQENGKALEDVLKNNTESRKQCMLAREPDIFEVKVNNKDDEFWEAQSIRIQQLEHDLCEANLKVETYEQVLRSINESRRTYLVEYEKQRNSKIETNQNFNK